MADPLALRGTSLPEQVPLRAGPLTLVLESGDLRSVCLGSVELARRIYGAVRDRSWNTVPGVLSRVTIDRAEDRFALAYRSTHRDGEIDFSWNATITGSPDGSIVFAFAGEAASAFDRNRIGLCVLHPMRECAGLPASARHVDGSTSEVRFPELVAIEQPIQGFHNLAGLSYRVAGADVELLFEGDTFETEDQRNWIDASFKTYSTPLGLPRPVRIERGTRVEQRVVLRVAGSPPGRVGSLSQRRNLVEIRRVDAGPMAMPAVGLGFDGEDRGAAGAGTPGALRPAHLRLDLPFRRGWQARLERAVSAHQRLGSALELALEIDESSAADLEELAGLLPDARDIARVLVFATGRPTTTAAAFDLAARHLRGTHPDLPLGAGSRRDLYEFHLHPPSDAALLCWGINPQAHATDVTSIAETPPAAGEQVLTVRRRHPHAAVAISPITLGPRSRRDGGLTEALDPIHGSLLGAAWILAVTAHLGRSGAHSLTLFEQLDPLRPHATSRTPLWHVVADLGDCQGGQLLPIATGTDEVAALLVQHGARGLLLLANLGRQPREVRLPAQLTPVRVRVIDRTTALAAAREPASLRAGTAPAGETLTLEPWATARVDGELSGPP